MGEKARKHNKERKLEEVTIEEKKNVNWEPEASTKSMIFMKMFIQ